MSRSEQSRVAQRGRAFALIVAAAFAGACGDDSGDDDKAQEDSGKPVDAARPDAAQDAGGGMDASRDASTDAGRDAGTVDAGPLAIEGMDTPTLTKVGFYDDELGLRILISGSDKNGDIKSYDIAFFSDVMGMTPVSVNTSGDSSEPGSPTLSEDIAHNATYQDFLVKLEPSGEFDGPKSIRVTVKDAGGRISEEKLAKREMAPPVSSACDPNGFNRCSGTTFCAPNNSGNYSCANVKTAQQTACTGNAVLTLAAPGSVDGTLSRASLWDGPTGCVAGDSPTGLADKIVKVTLASAAPKLTLSTGETPKFRAVIYQLPTATPLCTAAPAACGNDVCPTCTDGAPLVLTNVAAGDYFFVVERNPTELDGDTFTLTATIGQ